MTKEGYQPIKTKKTIKIIPPNTGSNVQMKKDGYTWEDLDKAWWEGFDNAKNKMEKRIAELEAQIDEMKQCGNCGNRTVGNCEHCKRKPKQKSTDTDDYWQLKEIKEK